MSIKRVLFGRKQFSFGGGVPVLESIVITEKPLKDEDEAAFTQRLVHQYSDQHGTIEMVIKNGLPDYALITLEVDHQPMK
jgi:hypothetical protein